MKKTTKKAGGRKAFIVRTSPELHAEIERLASERERSVNDEVVDALKRHIGKKAS